MANDERRKPSPKFWDWYSSLSQEQHGSIFGHAGYSLRPPDLPQYERGGSDITPADWSQTTNITQNFQNEYQIEQQAQLDSRGIPIDWDYRISTTGPFGQALPQGAQGWDP